MINIINMIASEWIDAGTACAMLSVKPQTLYAYVSRGLLRAQADAGDARRSLYARSDVEVLLQQNRRPRARAEIAEQAIRWGEPVLATAISEVRDGMLWLRGLSIRQCAETFSLEEMAAHLWCVNNADFAASDVLSTSADPIGRALETLARQVPTAAAMHKRRSDDIAKEGGGMVSVVTNALLGVAEGGPIHLRLARVWGTDADGTEDLRRALVLLSDHELNPSTFAVRIAASTGAGLPAALLSGLATLSGPRHGGVASLARQALKAAQTGEMDAFLNRIGGQEPYGFGYGHPLYPDGDPRARIILDHLPQNAPSVAAVRLLSRQLDLPPNIDAALAALSIVRQLPEEAALTIFAAGRVVGWIAHAIEQVESGDIIRPRARYRAKG